MLGRKAPGQRPAIFEARPLTPDDLRVLAKPRNNVGVIKTLREKHHRIARLDAAGLSNAEICELTGVAPVTLSNYRRTPAYCELRAKFLAAINEAAILKADDLRAIDYHRQTSIRNMKRAEVMIEDALDEAEETGEKIPLGTLRAIVADRADRFGYGKHTTQTNLHIGMATRIEAATERVSRIRTIEGTTAPTPQPPSTSVLVSSRSPAPTSSPPSPRSLNRRGF